MSATATSTADLVPELCAHFQQATGWSLRFRPATAGFEKQYAELERDPACCWIGCISDGQRPAGMLWLERPENSYPSAGFVEAAGLAEAIGRLLDQLAEASSQLTLRDEDVSTLLNLGLTVPAQDDLAFSQTQLLKAATHLTNSRSAAFFLLDSNTRRLKLRALYQLTGSEVVAPERELCDSAPDLRAMADAPVVVRADRPGALPILPSSMHVGLVAGVQSDQAPFGTLWVYDRRDKQYNQRDRHILQSIAAQFAAVLERSALLHGSAQQDRLYRDLEAAAHSQCDVNLRSLPLDARYEIAARCTSCYELGGDLCESLPLENSRIAVAVGDASGNSIPAAMIMSAVRGALRTHPASADDVTRRIVEINKTLCHITNAQQFMSLCYGVLDPATRCFVYCNAGHPSPLLFRDGQAICLDSHGLLLGVLPDAEYDCSTLQLDRGDLLVLYSDGISEARNAGHVLFGTAGIISSVCETPCGTAQQTLETVWRQVVTHVADSRFGDDRTLLMLRIT